MIVRLLSAVVGVLLVAWIVVYKFGCRLNAWWSGVELDAPSSMGLLIAAFVMGLVLRLFWRGGTPRQ